MLGMISELFGARYATCEAGEPHGSEFFDPPPVHLNTTTSAYILCGRGAPNIFLIYMKLPTTIQSFCLTYLTHHRFF